jgi:hypothetical protein
MLYLTADDDIARTRKWGTAPVRSRRRNVASWKKQ